MKRHMSKLAKTIASAGVACLLLGAFARGPSAMSLPVFPTNGWFTSGTASVSNTRLDAIYYGEWDFIAGGWITANSKMLYGSDTVTWTVPSGGGWYVMVLYNSTLGYYTQFIYLYKVYA